MQNQFRNKRSPVRNPFSNILTYLRQVILVFERRLERIISRIRNRDLKSWLKKGRISLFLNSLLKEASEGFRLFTCCHRVFMWFVWPWLSLRCCQFLPVKQFFMTFQKYCKMFLVGILGVLLLSESFPLLLPCLTLLQFQNSPQKLSKLFQPLISPPAQSSPNSNLFPQQWYEL